MKQLSVQGNQIVTEEGTPIYLKGVNIGGWLNMEDFINGYPGSEQSLRKLMTDEIGEEKSQVFFDSLHHHFFNEEDLAFITSLGLNTIRLPLNYRQFEDDLDPFTYKEEGFEKVDAFLDLCEKYNVYVILDMHAVQGFQNTHWHSDNNSRNSFFWREKHYQERFINLWKAIAERYKGRSVIAGYDLMNEPAVNTPYGDYPHTYFDQYKPDWSVINELYKTTVEAIREVDPDHIIILEGDLYSRLFEGLDAPFTHNLVYSSHNYTAAGFGPGKYPGTITPRNLNTESGDFAGDQQQNYWDYERQIKEFEQHEGPQYAAEHNVPLIVTEFGSVYNGPVDEVEDRLRALKDQLAVFKDHNTHWTLWTYKDVGVMGLAMLDDQSPYMKRIEKVIRLKETLNTDDWMKWLPGYEAKDLLKELAVCLVQTIDDESMGQSSVIQSLTQAVLTNYVATLIQPVYVNRFKDLSSEDIESLLSSFAFENCKVNHRLADVLKNS
ncbi:MAG: glycoside hydrolase family 5 protein [Alkalibacterium sp.]|nr:glycoside hydrolase family 5 protein [Alkalibacterium sp.]